jgi:hypothetical protein
LSARTFLVGVSAPLGSGPVTLGLVVGQGLL